MKAQWSPEFMELVCVRRITMRVLYGVINQSAAVTFCSGCFNTFRLFITLPTSVPWSNSRQWKCKSLRIKLPVKYFLSYFSQAYILSSQTPYYMLSFRNNLLQGLLNSTDLKRRRPWRREEWSEVKWVNSPQLILLNRDVNRWTKR